MRKVRELFSVRNAPKGKSSLGILALTTVVVSTSLVLGGGGSSGTEVANAWVSSTSGTCVRSSTLLTYTEAVNQGKLCPRLADAVAIAQPGDKIYIRAGAYPFETIAFRASLQDLSPGCDPYGAWGTANTTNCIHIRNDGDVKIRGMDNHASSLWFQGNVTGTSGAGCGTPQACKNRTYDFHVSNEDLIGNPPPGADDDAQCNCNSVRFRTARPNPASDSTKSIDHVIVDGLDTDSTSVHGGADFIHWRNLDIGPIWADTNIRGEKGNAVEQSVIRATGPCCTPHNIVIENIFLHESNRTFWCDVNNACHPDGLYMSNGGPITIRNSAFAQIAGEPFFFESFNEGLGNENIHDVLIENSWFGCKVNSYPDAPATARTTCGSGPAIDIKNCGTAANGGCEDMLWRYNSWHGIGGAEITYTNARFIGNAGKQPPSGEPFCSAATWNHNVWYTAVGGSNCGATNANTGSSSSSSLFVNVSPGSEDFHLSGAPGSTLADGFVTPNTSDYVLGTDFDGQSRTAGSRDAGADER